MTYRISWHTPNHILYIEIIGRIAVAEFEQLHQETFAYVAASPHKVHAIADISQFETYPNNLRLLSAAAHKDQDDNQGMTVLVTPYMPRLLYFFVSVILQKLQLEYRLCQTVEEALEILRRSDPQLAPIIVSSGQEPKTE
jgi:hypothetical protein